MISKETYEKVLNRDMYLCQHCGRHANHSGTMQLAHRIRQGVQAEKHIMIYIWHNYHKDRGRAWVDRHIINSDLNLVTTCSLSCNSSFNIFTKSVLRDDLIRKIIDETQCLKYESDK